MVLGGFGNSFCKDTPCSNDGKLKGQSRNPKPLRPDRNEDLGFRVVLVFSSLRI